MTGFRNELMFPSTRQTLLDHAIRGEASELNALVEMYWQPCYRYVKWRFHAGHEEAQDLVQTFFASVIEQEIVERFDRGRGSFRPYLRSCLEQSVMKQLTLESREKRGGGVERVGLEAGVQVASLEENPEQRFEREWEREVFALAVAELKAACDDSVRYQVFAAYDLAESERPSYEELARRHEIPVTAVTNHLAWARRELGKLVRKRL
jgi:RNA polymerase sigma factor (sigma-70 family)